MVPSDLFPGVVDPGTPLGPVLTEIADVTDGSYNRAGDSATLQRVYESVDLKLERVERQREVTAVFAAAGGLVLALGSLLSIAWFGRVI